MIAQAIRFAEKAHDGQVRKGTGIPYIVHPLETADIVANLTKDEKLITAAVLHDTIEDCEAVTAELIEANFGKEVAAYVVWESEDKGKSWEERKSATIHKICCASKEQKLIALGDKLSNMRSIYKDYCMCQDEVFQKFRVKDKRKVGWYYRGLRASLAELGSTAEFQEYSLLFDKVFTG